ncbi:hypothetical protein DH2020_015918 [Rehmannia glutinosa]|uniref:Uncharacterized protein n=1 Tax=Rehmannia glutinosa TaxID=99300 RepID=A0ABR0WVK4_REHGL
MMSPNQIPDNRGSSRPATFRQTPLQVIHIIGNLMRIWSVYSMYRYLSETGASVVLFIFSCLVPASILFLLLQKPWKGRPLSNTQVVPSVINGGITALYFILWGKGLKSCGPLSNLIKFQTVLSSVYYYVDIEKALAGDAIFILILTIVLLFYVIPEVGVIREVDLDEKLIVISFLKLCDLRTCGTDWVILAEYSGAVLGVLSGVFDSQDAEVQSEEVLGVKEMLIPIFAGILSALRRVIARRVSLKNQLKRRLNAITIASAACFLFPVAMWDMIIGSTSIGLPFSAWAFSSFILFGITLIFYVDSIAEERLEGAISALSPVIDLVTPGSGIFAFNLIPLKNKFRICLFPKGIHEATSLDRVRKDSLQSSDISNGVYEDRIQMSPLPT